ncbi:MAG: DUF11 domain-containing protein [Clostridia bacterium]|nr:DUF11 domain-containing protein [Clostridia bacterium]
MKLRKGLMQILTIVSILATVLSIATISNATLYSSGSERLLKLVNPTYRPVYVNGNWVDAYSYSLGIKSTGSVKEQDMWKIYEYNKGTNGKATTVKNYANALYCLKAGPGFGSVNGSATEEKSYNVYADMKNPTSADASIINYYKNNIMASESDFTQDQKYNALIWVLDHCYVPAPSSDYGQNTEAAQKAAAYKSKLFQAAGIPNSYINDDMIDITQQIAIWYFTNNDQYKGNYVDSLGNHEGITDVWVTIKNGASTSIDDVNGPFNGRGIDLHLNDDIDKLFAYFINGGIANKNTVPLSTVTAPVQFTNTISQAEISGDYYIAGPYKLTETNSGIEYDLTASVKEGNNSISYTLLDSNKQTTSKSIKQLVGSDFYIKIPKTANLNNVVFNVTWTINQNTITYLTISGRENSEQPVAEIIPQVKSGNLTATIKYEEKIFDLALRKNISKVETNGETTTFENNGERKPNVDTTPLTSNLTTANYKHRKDPVLVETGSLVTYKLNIYNEGNIAGRATKVIDQLPTGVKFKNVVSGNFESDGTYNETTNKLTLVRKAGNTTDLAAFENGNLASETIEILCEVTALPDENDDKVLTNIAWIAEYASNEGTFTDRDSDGNIPTMPASLVTTDNGYTNNDTHELDDKNHYFVGQQDDDDFEKVKIKAVNGSYNIILVKEDKNGEQINETATFEVNGTQVTVTGRLTIVSNKTINADNVTLVDTYIIKELVPPDKYCKFDGTIKIEVYKELKDGKYVVKEIKYYVDDVEVTANRDDLKVYLNTNGNIYVEVKDYQFDLALRKFITKVQDVDVPTREPVIPEESNNKLQNGEITTVEKHHTKNPVRVQIGDTVLYKIRVYNEGDVAGYATEVTDYLPAGLTLKENSSINSKYGWRNPSGDGKTIITSYLADKLIPALTAGEEPVYEDLEIECVVNASASSSSQSLKNVAEITDDKDEKGNDVEDRDSTPKDLTEEQKRNYNPGESEKGWGYEDDDDYEELIIPAKEFDLALRKFIVSVNEKELKNEDGTYTREPVVDTTNLKAGISTKVGITAEYKHEKEPVNVSIGDIVIYALRVYNEGDIDGYVSEITDHLPPQLEFINDEYNASFGWTLDPNDSSKRTVKTKFLAKTEVDPEDNLLKAYDGGNKLDYREVRIKCRVKPVSKLDKVITNIADITAFTDVNGNTITDRDSWVNPGVTLPSDNDLPDYIGTSGKSILSDRNYFYTGQQDDDDFEKLILQEFDLALRKFITKINEDTINSREPVVDVSKLKSGESTTATYTHPKNPLTVETTDIVEYTIRVYNEGDIAGYANVVKDDIPKGLQFLPENETNIEYRWKMIDENGNETDDVSKAVDIITDYLSKEQEMATGRNNLIKAYDNAKDELDYRDVKVAFKVIAPNTYEGIITNKAQISEDKDENGRDVEDRDSTPDEWIEGEDDQDVEHIKLLYFDLALRKFITAVNDKEITDRVPVFKIDENGNYVYEHTKEPVEVENSNIVTYTLRIFNEGTKAGYANLVRDDIPEGLEFLPENELNKEYRWVMIDEDGNTTEDVKEAKSIVTDYLSIEQERATGRNNLLKAFDRDIMESPDYRDVKVAFRVTEPNTSDRIIINHAQISEDKDENGKDVTDIDSTPDEWIDGEDDQDIEKIKVKYFDLALRKWVTQAIVIENGEETVIETGHKAEDDPEEVVKVDLKERNYKNVVVKFRYSIRVTNEGEIAGYCTEISDYIPEGLKFVQEDNPEWREVDGKIVTDALKDTLLQPGESAEVEVLLTWINGKDNFGLKVNTAEISKDKNDSDTPDIDSVPNNKKPGEDDIDDAPVILTVKTGVENMMPVIGIIAVSVAIIGTGAVLIKKYVL